MEDALDFLQSRPLIGFNLDGSHLNNVLQDILQNQAQMQTTQRQLADRVNNIEDGLQEVTAHVKGLERAMNDLGVGGDKLAQIRARIDDIERGMDILHADVNDVKKIADTAAQDANAAGQLADVANRTAQPLKEAVDRLLADVDDFGRQHAQDQREVARALDGLAAARADQENRMNDALRDLEAKADRIANDNGFEKLRRLLEDLDARTDANFRHVEETSREVESVLRRHDADFLAVRSEMTALDDKTRARMVGLANEVDDKYETLLNAFREYERNSKELEEHLVKAGQALARRRDGR